MPRGLEHLEVGQCLLLFARQQDKPLRCPQAGADNLFMRLNRRLVAPPLYAEQMV